MTPNGWIASAAGLVLVGGTLLYTADRFARSEIAATHTAAQRPRVTAIEPAEGAVEVAPVTGIKCTITVPTGAGVDEKTLEAGVHLVRTRDGVEVEANRNTSGAGDDVVLVPKAPLELDTEYTFRVTSDLKDTAGIGFDAKSTSFRTAKSFAVSQVNAAFEQVKLDNTKQEKDAFTTLAIGPDGLLYAGTFAGMIHRYAINADGTLTPRGPLLNVIRENKGPRLITGITFDPTSNVDNAVMWISHGQFAMKDGRPEGADDWTGKLSRLFHNPLVNPHVVEKGACQFDTYQDVIVGLPRAYKDHLNFAPAFGPDGALYLSQGSNTSVGDTDVKWGYRPERKLTAAILKFDFAKLEPDYAKSLKPAPAFDDEDRILKPPLRTDPIDVKTEDGGTYDPAAKDAPLTLWATGVRSGFRLLLHRNGHFYTGVNGAAGNEGNTPASPDGTVPAIRDIKQTTDDLLLKLTPGAYYGHPNPARGQYVLAGGNPTAGPDVQEVSAYPVGTKPDAHYAPPAFVFGKNYSPNGLIDYHAQAPSPTTAPAGGPAATTASTATTTPAAGASPLDGCILVTRYSDGKDIIALKLNADGDVVETIAGLDGFTGLNAPLDLTEDPKTGNLYVAEYHGQRITLLRPIKDGISRNAQITRVGGR